MIVILNECLFENSAEERTKQVGTFRLNRTYLVTKNNDGIKSGKRKRYRRKERDEETK
jgi:hypothetical protein